MIIPPLIGPEQDAEIRRCVAYAWAHPIRLGPILANAQANPAATPVGNDPGHRVEFWVAYREVAADGAASAVQVGLAYLAVFSVEQALRNRDGTLGWVRHLSVSHADPTEPPGVRAVDPLLPLFGFRNTLANEEASLHIYLEAMSGGRQAVNIMEELAEGEGPPECTPTDPRRLEL